MLTLWNEWCISSVFLIHTFICLVNLALLNKTYLLQINQLVHLLCIKFTMSVTALWFCGWLHCSLFLLANMSFLRLKPTAVACLSDGWLLPNRFLCPWVDKRPFAMSFLLAKQHSACCIHLESPAKIFRDILTQRSFQSFPLFWAFGRAVNGNLDVLTYITPWRHTVSCTLQPAVCRLLLLVLVAFRLSHSDLWWTRPVHYMFSRPRWWRSFHLHLAYVPFDRAPRLRPRGGLCSISGRLRQSCGWEFSLPPSALMMSMASLIAVPAVSTSSMTITRLPRKEAPTRVPPSPWALTSFLLNVQPTCPNLPGSSLASSPNVAEARGIPL